MGLKFGKAVTMIVERYGWSAFDNLNAINDPDLCKAVEMVRKVRKKKDDIHANKTGADLRRTRPPREKIEKMVAAHDVGKAVNPLSCEGQIEGGVVMSMGYALRERYPIDDNCKPIEKYGSLGLFRAHEVPEIEAIVIDKPGLNVACGAIGIGEITSIPTAPAIADAYFRLDGQRRLTLPLENTPYARKK